MTISELILRLIDIKKEHGDIRVGLYDQEFDAYSECHTVNNKTDHNRLGARAQPAVPCDDKSLGDSFVGLS
jgi:hypothetical protein